MGTVAYIIYFCLCAFVGMVCAKADINFKDWKYWAILGSVIAVYFCGAYQ